MSFPLKNNGNIQKSLTNIVNSGRMPHAFLIESENETDGMRLARYIAGIAVCSGEAKPCGKCRECLMASGNNHPDISVTEPENGKKTIPVSAVREIRSDAYIKPHSADSRVFIINGAQKMNPQAQNALLKVLEEPPQGVVFILTVPSRTLLLDTVLSRCTLLSVNSEEKSAKKSKAREIAESFVGAIFTESEFELLKILAPLEKSRVLADEFFAELQILVAECMRENLTNTARMRTLNGLYENIKDYKEQLALNINLPLLFSAMVCKIEK